MIRNLKKNDFSVYPPPAIGKMVFWGALLFTMVPVAFTIFQGRQHPACYICFALLVTPFFCFSVWAKFFRVTVKENVITVQRGIGTKYSFPVSEITKATRRLNHTKLGNTENITMGKITIKTKSHKVSVDSLMLNVEKMDAFIREQVSPDLIITKEITWRK